MTGGARRILHELGRLLLTLVLVVAGVAVVAVVGGWALDRAFDTESSVDDEDTEMAELQDALRDHLPLLEELPAPDEATSDDAGVMPECIEDSDAPLDQPAAQRTWVFGDDIEQARVAGFVTIAALETDGWVLDPDTETETDSATLHSTRDGEDLTITVSWHPADANGGATTYVELRVDGLEPCADPDGG